MDRTIDDKTKINKANVNECQFNNKYGKEKTMYKHTHNETGRGRR